MKGREGRGQNRCKKTKRQIINAQQKATVKKTVRGSQNCKRNARRKGENEYEIRKRIEAETKEDMRIYVYIKIVRKGNQRVGKRKM